MFIMGFHLNVETCLNMYQYSHHGEFCGRCFFDLINVQVKAKVTANPSSSFFSLICQKKSHLAQTKLWFSNQSWIILYQWAIVDMNGQWYVLQLLYSVSAASKNWLVMVVLTLMALASGNERFGVVQSICYAWMFDEGTGIKSQECAGIQILCEYIISSIIPPYDCTSGLARQTLTGLVLLPQAPASSPPSWSPQPACEGAPCLICQLSLL